MKVIMTRGLRLVNSELVRTPWEVLEYVNPEKLPRRLAFWQELNDYAVSERGPSTKREFKIEEETSQ